MRNFRTAVATAGAACALLLVGGVGSAAAQDALPFAKTVPVTGQAKNGKKFTGTYTIKKFKQSNGKAVAVGTLKGKLKGRHVRRTGVRMPASIADTGSTFQVPTPGACPVLNLNLGPINLNLLGLRIATNQINLLIEAIPGAGNLLGNLLCAVTNLLNPSAQTPLQQLLAVLNALLALAPPTPATAAARPAVATSG
jgi:hypothetical protein